MAELDKFAKKFSKDALQDVGAVNTKEASDEASQEYRRYQTKDAFISERSVPKEH